MKKILSIIVLLTIFSCGKTNSHTSVFKELSNSQKLKLPYGDKDLLYNFSKDWNSGDALNDSLYNNLSSFVFQEFENSNRKTFKSNYTEAKAFLDKDFIVSDAVKNKNEKLEIKTALLLSSNKIQVFSIIYKGKIDCKNCEFPESQTQNNLVSFSNGKIIDKLLIASIVGNDLGQSSRYFYIDSDETIHLKDFTSDEEGTSFIQYLKYKVEKGKFIKQSE